MKHYNYVLVSNGLYAGVFAQYARKDKKTYPAPEKRDHIEGSIYCENVERIHVRKYGAHIFHTSNKGVWGFVNSLVEFDRYTSSPVASPKGEMCNIPFNMSTFGKMRDISIPDEVEAVIEKQGAEMKEDSRNLKEQVINLVGRELYEKLIKGYTEKQQGRDCRELPTLIAKRIPARYTHDNNYFNSLYQGIPIGRYNMIMEELFEGCGIETRMDYPESREHCDGLGEIVIYTGTIDAFYSYRPGKLEYRSLGFGSQVLEEENHQGMAIVNYTDKETPYIRVIEHKHFEFESQPKTVITREYPVSWQEGMESYYPVDNRKSQELSYRYEKLAKAKEYVWSGDHLGEYRYYDTDKVIGPAMGRAEEISG